MRATGPLIITWAISSLAAVAWSLAGMTIDRAPVEMAGRANLDVLWPFWIASASAWLALGALWVMLWRRERGKADAAARATPAQTGARFRTVALLVIGVAVAARGAVLLTHEPALSDDVYRYVFDGRNGAAGINPYLVVPITRPGARAGRAERPLTFEPASGPAAGADGPAGERWPGEARTVARINNADLPTIYLPASQWVFRGAGTVTPRDWTDPDLTARAFRAVFVVVEIVGIVLLAFVLAGRGRSAWWLTLYAWHPLPLAEIAGAGHQDALGVTLLLAALLCFEGSRVRLLRGIGAFALAGLVKPVAIPVAVLALRGRSWRCWLAGAILGAVVTGAVALPYFTGDAGEAVRNLAGTAREFSLKWAHFGSAYEPLLAFIEYVTPEWTNDPQERLARSLCLGLLALVFAIVWWRGRDAWRDATWLFLAMVLLSPTAHPWYLLWALALLPISRNAGVWVASLTLPWGYAVLGDTVGWSVEPWVMWIAYVPIYLALLGEATTASESR